LLLILFLIIKLFIFLLPAILIVIIFWYLFIRMNKLKKKGHDKTIDVEYTIKKGKH